MSHFKSKMHKIRFVVSVHLQFAENTFLKITFRAIISSQFYVKHFG